MNNTLFEKTGIKLTDIQKKILKELLVSLFKAVIFAALVFGAGIATKVITPSCMHTTFNSAAAGSRNLACVDQNHVLPGWVPGVVMAIFVLIFVPFLVHGISYLGKLVTDKEFRESEMAQSVDFMEEDEREQLMTMRGELRAYMVLNFTLLVFWIICLVTGDFSKAVTLFIVQAIGALTYRRSMRN